MRIARCVSVACLLLAIAPFTNVAAEELSHYTGEQLYQRFCAACHGEKAEGDGPVAPFFKLAPPNLTELAKRRKGEFPEEQVRKIIDGRDQKLAHGTRSMPIWGMEFYYADTGNPDKQKPVEELIDRLVQYLRTLQKS